MTEIHDTKIQRRVRHEARSPRTAALDGIGYSILMITRMILLDSIVRVRLEEITPAL
jgi:hypothetical protein